MYWVLTGTGKQHDGTSWLKPNREYNLGREQHNDFIFNHQKISKDHLSVRVVAPGGGDAVSTVQLCFKGKITKLNQQIIKRSSDAEKAVTRTIDHRAPHISIRLGPPSVTCQISITKTLYVLKLPRAFTGVANLDQLDINYTYVNSSNVTHYVYDDTSDKLSLSLMFWLIKQVPIVSIAFINRMYDSGEPNLVDFTPFQIPGFEIDHRRADIFTGIKFVFGSARQFNNFESVLESGKGDCQRFDFTEQKQAFLDYIDTIDVSKLVMVKIDDKDSYDSLVIMNELSKKLNKNLVSIETIFNAVKEVDLKLLLTERAGVPQESLRVKRRKRNKEEVKQLNVLDFFAGGKFKKESQTPVPKAVVPEVVPGPPKQPEPPVVEILDSEEEPELIELDVKPKAKSEIIASPEPASESKPDDQDIPPKRKISSEEPAPLVKRPKESFTEIIKEAKKNANERSYEKYGDNTEVLDNEEIMGLKDLAIVEVNDRLLRARPVPEPVGVGKEKSNVKNFKKFVKNSKNGGKVQTFLYSRQYIPLVVYDPKVDDVNIIRDREFLKGIDEQVDLQNAELEKNFGADFSQVRNKKEEKLFVDSDYEESAAASPEGMSVDADDGEGSADAGSDKDSESDDEVPKFRFRN